MKNVGDAQDVQVNTADGSIADSIESKIFNIRGKQVMLDRDLAVLYGVETKRLNEQVRRNVERFPENFMFQLNDLEFENWKSQLATSIYSGSDTKLANTLKMGIRRHPFAFTEEGVAMLSTVLNSAIAVQTSIKIMNAFVQMRHNIFSFSGHEQRIVAIERHMLETDQKIDHVLNCLEEGTLKEKAHIFSAGQIYEARSFIADLISKANFRIILIDGYIGAQTLDLLDARKAGVTAQIITYSINSAMQNLVDQYNVQFPNKPLSIRTWNVDQHDRWLIIDDDLWHCGASLKDVGVRTFCIDPIGMDVNIIMMHI